MKTLEEPPPHAIFVLATTEPDRVPETVRSRCQRFDFRRIPTGEIVAHLAEILKSEGSQADADSLVAIARRSTGSMRDAVSLLDQLLSYGDERLTLGRVEGVLGLVNAQTIGKLTDFLAAHDAAAGLALINRLVSDGVELGQLVDQIVAYLRGVLFVRVTRAPEQLDLPQDVVAIMARQAETLTPAAILTALREFTEARARRCGTRYPVCRNCPSRWLSCAARSASAAESVPVMVPRAVAPAAILPAGPAIAQAAALPPRGPETGKPARQPEPIVSAAPRVPAEQPATTKPLPPAQTAPATPPADADLLGAAQSAWDPFIKLAGQRCGMKVQAALRGVKRLDATGGMLIMQFSHTFSRDLVSQGENRALVEGVWQEVLGRKVGVRYSVAGETAAATPAPASPPAGGAPPDPTPVNDDEVLLGDARKLGATVKPLM